jgi:hypothetical protein
MFHPHGLKPAFAGGHSLCHLHMQVATHKHSCSKTKTRLSSALDKVRDVFREKKHRKQEDMARQEVAETADRCAIAELPVTEALLPIRQHFLEPTQFAMPTIEFIRHPRQEL